MDSVLKKYDFYRMSCCFRPRQRIANFFSSSFFRYSFQKDRERRGGREGGRGREGGDGRGGEGREEGREGMGRAPPV